MNQIVKVVHSILMRKQRMYNVCLVVTSYVISNITHIRMSNVGLYLAQDKTLGWGVTTSKADGTGVQCI